MFQPNELLDTLQEALDASPENTKLRMHFAEMLLKNGRGQQAANHYLFLLEQKPNDAEIRLGLVKAYWSNGEQQKYMPLLNAFMDEIGAPAAAIMLYARAKANMLEFETAFAAYNQAIELDSALGDKDLLLQMKTGLSNLAAIENVQPVSATNANINNQLYGYLEKPEITFANVGGLEALKESIRSRIVYPFQNPELYRVYGKEAGGGLLLYGPPGVGKTFLARATAGEINATFISVGITDVLDKWVGNSEKQLHNFFEYARKNAPCVLFFDEIDALAGSRDKSNSQIMTTLVNQFLAEFDGVKHSNKGVLVIGATNTLWRIDDAFRRPGRFDDIIFVPPPDQTARVTILRELCKDKPTEELDYLSIAKQTDGYSGADLKGLVDRAIDAILREAIRDGIPKPIKTVSLIDALKLSRPTTKEWFATAQNFVKYANSGGLYDDLHAYLK